MIVLATPPAVPDAVALLANMYLHGGEHEMIRVDINVLQDTCVMCDELCPPGPGCTVVSKENLKCRVQNRPKRNSPGLVHNLGELCQAVTREACQRLRYCPGLVQDVGCIDLKRESSAGKGAVEASRVVDATTSGTVLQTTKAMDRATQVSE